MDIDYRKAEATDLQLFFNWVNDPEVRSNSYNSNAISLEEHTNWFLKKIADKNTFLYVAALKGQPVGMVRFDIEDEHAMVSILLDKNFRGMGLASILLTDCCKLYFDVASKPVWAYIKNSNLASVHAFRKAGFAFLREDTINSVESQIFSKEK